MHHVVRLGAVALALFVMPATPASALNEVYESTCGAYPCIKPPKENLCFKQAGDFDANGAGAQAIGALAKGKKKSILKIDVTYEWFTLSNQFRPFTLKVNNKFSANFTILNHLDSCPNGFCLRSSTWFYDLDTQELQYPGEFYGQPLVITVDSGKVADAGSTYNVTVCAQLLKKK